MKQKVLLFLKAWYCHKVMRLEAWYCHKLRLPGARPLCDRFDEWVMRGGEDEQPQVEGLPDVQALEERGLRGRLPDAALGPAQARQEPAG